MRAIDADALIKDNDLENAVKYPIGDGHGYYTRMLYEIKDMIEDAPTLDVKDLLPQGEWEECDWFESDEYGQGKRIPKEGLLCTNCKHVFKKNSLWKSNHCPNCGAYMMRKEGEK